MIQLDSVLRDFLYQIERPFDLRPKVELIGLAYLVVSAIVGPD